MAHSFEHIPVLRDEVVSLFASVPPGVVVDATVGGGGHAAALLEAYPTLRIVGLDRDPAALEAARARLSAFGDRVTLLAAPFSTLESVLSRLGLSDRLAGVLLDLGVSSPQLDWSERGFSFRQDGPLDMRMDPTSGPTAADLVNTLPVEELATLFRRERRGEAVRAHRPCCRPSPATDLHEAAGRSRGIGRAGAGPPEGSPCPAGVPGAAHRGERRARPAGGGAARRLVAPGRRGRVRRDQLPLGGGPADQAGLRRGRLGRVRLPAGSALCLRSGGAPSARVPWRPQAIGSRRSRPILVRRALACGPLCARKPRRPDGTSASSGGHSNSPGHASARCVVARRQSPAVRAWRRSSRHPARPAPDRPHSHTARHSRGPHRCRWGKAAHNHFGWHGRGGAAGGRGRSGLSGQRPGESGRSAARALRRAECPSSIRAGRRHAGDAAADCGVCDDAAAHERRQPRSVALRLLVRAPPHPEGDARTRSPPPTTSTASAGAPSGSGTSGSTGTSGSSSSASAGTTATTPTTTP